MKLCLENGLVAGIKWSLDYYNKNKIAYIHR